MHYHTVNRYLAMLRVMEREVEDIENSAVISQDAVVIHAAKKAKEDIDALRDALLKHNYEVKR